MGDPPFVPKTTKVSGVEAIFRIASATCAAGSIDGANQAGGGARTMVERRSGSERAIIICVTAVVGSTPSLRVTRAP